MAACSCVCSRAVSRLLVYSRNDCWSTGERAPSEVVSMLLVLTIVIQVIDLKYDIILVILQDERLAVTMLFMSQGYDFVGGIADSK